MSFFKLVRKIDEHCTEIAFVFERGSAQKNLVHIETRVQVDLNARVGFQHVETKRVFPADELPFRINANIEMVVEQIVVCPVRSVGSQKNVRWLCRLRRLSCCWLCLS